tara:strand:- start:422 stop:1366 length:945 start_codon:yes stop_codon:yes gene_type:complete
MSFDVSALPAYTEQHAMDLIVKSVAGGRLSQYANLQPGVKTTTTINILDTDVVFQADGCSRTADGSTTLTQRNLTPGAIAIHEDLCMSDLATKYTATMLKAGLTGEKEEIPFEELYFSHKVAKVQKAIEVADWQGDTASGTANLNKYDGLVKLIGAASPVNGNPTGITTGTGIVSTNVIGILTGMAELMPEDIMDADDLKLFVGMDTFLTYQKAIADGNYFHYVVDQDYTAELPLIGFPNVTVCATPGLSGIAAGNCYLLRASNIYIGVDLPEEESNDVRSWYDENDRIYKVTMAFRRAVNVAFGDQVVEFELV